MLTYIILCKAGNNMERIDLDIIDLETLSKMKCKDNIESDLYRDEELVYKIFKDFKDLEKSVLDKKERKIELLHDGIPLPRSVMPKDKLTEKDIFGGYRMKYIAYSQTLYSLFKETNDINLFFQILLIVSQTVEEIHLDPRNIIVGDLHFGNILVDKNFNPYFIDLDSCGIDGISNETTPGTLNTYRYNREIKDFNATKNSDRLCLVLCTLGLLFKHHIDFVSMREFDKKAEQIETLRNMRELVDDIKKYSSMPQILYIHEFIASSDLQRQSLIPEFIVNSKRQRERKGIRIWEQIKRI